MAYPVFTVPAGDVIPIFFATYAGATGASVTLTGLAATDIEVYKDGGVTQRSSDAGYTLLDTDGIDFDGITGIHGISIDTGDNTDAGFYTVGAWFTVVVSAVTVDSQTVNFVAAQFRLMAAESIAAKPKVDVDGWLGTACATPTTNGVPEVDLTHIAGSAVSTTTAQLGVNVVQISADGTAADNAEAFFDGTGYAGTNNVIPTVTTTTNLTNERGKYAMGAVWIGPTANTNTASYVDGIITNPVSTIAAAKTVADALGMRRFEIIRTGTVQIGAALAGYLLSGTGWTCTTTGGSRDVGTTAFIGGDVSSGTFASTTGTINWDDCEFATGVTVGVSDMIGCRFAGTLTLGTAGDYNFIDCASIVAGTSAPEFAIPAGTVTVSFRRWSGGIRITGITSGTTISIDAVSGGTVTLEGADGTVVVRGMVTGVTDSRTGAPSLTQTAVVNQGSIADAVWDEAAAGHVAAGSFGTQCGTDIDAILDDTGTSGVVSVTGSVGSVATGGIAAASFAAGAIDAAAIAASAIGASEIADGAIDAATFAAGAINAAAIADGAIDAATFAAGAIDAAAIATDAIDADALAADAVTEIWGKAIAELAQAAPSATPSVLNALALLYMAARNQVTVTATTKSFTNDAGTVIFKKALSDDGTTYTEAEAVSGP